jgi:hypothetical protein
MDDAEYENVINHNVCYTEPLCATRSQAGSYLVRTKNNYEYWGVNNPTGNVIVVVNRLPEKPVIQTKESEELMEEFNTLEGLNPFTSTNPKETCICEEDWTAMCEERVVDIIKEMGKSNPSILKKHEMRVKAFEKRSHKWYVTEGCMGKVTYERSFQHLIKNEEARKFYDDFFDDNEGEYLEYCRVGFRNPTDSKCEFSSIWFLEYFRDFIPVVLKGVNTSSALAMEMCGMDRDEEEQEEDEEPYNEHSLDTIVRWAFEDKELVRALLLQ